MTRLPHENRSVRGYDPGDKFPQQKLDEVCSHPHCEVRGRLNLELHELWARSFLRGQPIKFVQLWDGTILGNQVYLCNALTGNGHHQKITENKAIIEYHLGQFYWFDHEDADGELLNPQPALYGSEKPQEGKHPLYGQYDSSGYLNVVDTFSGGIEDHLTEEQKQSGEYDIYLPPCPKCKGTGKKPPEPEKKKEKARNRVSKSIRVPKDEQENGVEVLEDMLEQVEEILRPGEKPRSPYYTLTDALGLVIVNKDVIL